MKVLLFRWKSTDSGHWVVAVMNSSSNPVVLSSLGSVCPILRKQTTWGHLTNICNFQGRMIGVHGNALNKTGQTRKGMCSWLGNLKNRKCPKVAITVVTILYVSCFVTRPRWVCGLPSTQLYPHHQWLHFPSQLPWRAIPKRKIRRQYLLIDWYLLLFSILV